MINDLLSVLDEKTVANYRDQIVRAVVYALLEGVTVGLTLPTLAAVLRGSPSAIRWLLALAIATAITLIVNAWATRKATRATFDAMAGVQELEIAHIREVPLDWFSPRHNAELISLLWPGAISTTRNVLLNLGALARGVLTPAVVLVFAGFTSAWAALIMLVAAPLLYGVYRVTTRRLEQGERADHAANVEATARIIEYADSQPTLRTAHRDTVGKKLLMDALDDLDSTSRAGVTAEITARAAFGTAVQLTVAVLVAVIASQLLGGSADLIVLIALLTMALRFTEPIDTVASTARMLRASRSTIRRTVEFLSTAPLPAPAVAKALPEQEALGVRLDAVTFRYAGADEPALHNISLDIPERSTVAIVGASGAGKSTLLRLILRFADPAEGSVQVGGIDVRDVPFEQLCTRVGSVLAETVLLDRTIADNVRLANPSASDAELAAAARLSGLDEVIRRLPEGWDTVVGAHGARLSGGEQQRVHLTRIAVQQPAVVILDEATSALDPISESVVQRWLAEMSGQRTLIIAAHRLHTIMSADQVIVLSEGTVVEAGSPQELAGLDGVFARMLSAR
ncbi:putative ABC transporter, permease/ATP-binding protein [Nocardia nova SH22a]|uniref:Putative ABC transporter, permease/ATP-binding protein n=1 Tax=Nocardia nova SH22a TaxID=1415166 RepID=W5TGC7_9NOCA|nr:ABC transporter ATP-binding protein [Nocardia nova]AHH18375.1 putative ABC transporter, permease/ATP-binding protein [Nocardia nova SH22a]